MLSSIYYLVDFASKTLLLKVDLFMQQNLSSNNLFSNFSAPNPICSFMRPFKGFDINKHPFILTLE